MIDKIKKAKKGETIVWDEREQMKTLSDNIKRIKGKYRIGRLLYVEDVKEAVKELKNSVLLTSNDGLNDSHIMLVEIDKIFGKELTE